METRGITEFETYSARCHAHPEPLHQLFSYIMKSYRVNPTARRADPRSGGSPKTPVGGANCSVENPKRKV
jgi:hypothetical protein